MTNRNWGNPELFNPPIMLFRRAERELIERFCKESISRFYNHLQEDGEFLEGDAWKSRTVVGRTIKMRMPERFNLIEH